MSDPIDWLAYLEADPQYEPYLSIARAWRIDRANLSLADDAVTARDQIIKDLGFQLGMAEEGLANYEEEMEGAKHDIERLVQSVSGEANEVERLRAALKRYGRHKVSCPASGIFSPPEGASYCTCGFEGITAVPQPAEHK